MLATSALDPTFGTAGLVTIGTTANAYAVTATTVQSSDGKILTAGTYETTAGNSSTAVVFVRRYNPDGSPDTSFGTNGQASIPVPATTTEALNNPNNIAVQSNGTIDLAYTALTLNSTGNTGNGVVAQLTAAGQLDSTFGTNGEYELPMAGTGLTKVAIENGNQVVALGTTYGNSNPSDGETLVIRLTTAGALDTTFNGTGQLAFSPSSGFVTFTAAGIVIAPSGDIIVATTQRFIGFGGVYTTDTGILAGITSAGTLDTGYGSNGYVSLPSSGSTSIGGIALQSSGNLIVTGMNQTSAFSTSTPYLIRLLPTGATDSSFGGIPLLTSTSTPPLTSGAFRSVAVATDGTIIIGGSFGPATKTNSPQLLVERFTTAGLVDTSFGQHGRVTIAIPVPSNTSDPALTNAGVALTPSNKIVVAGLQNVSDASDNPVYQSMLAQVLPVRVFVTATDDFDGDGKSDIAAELTANALYAYRNSNGTGDVLQQFGQKGFGASIPVSGDFDGDGKPDVAIYLPALGEFAYRPSSGGNDVVVQFGPSGTGASIPCPGDYFGTGVTAMAVYIPSQGNFAIRGPNGVGNVLVPFGIKGAGQSIPAPGDYDGDGETDLAVYIPSQGILAYRPSSGGPDVKVQFGSAGAGASIPAPGDYDGDGKTDVAVYIPSQGQFAVHPSSHAANYYIPFGMPGAGDSIPAPGDYDGDGKTDAAVYLPGSGEYAYRPSSGGNDVVEGFGQADAGRTVPTTSIPYAFPPVPPVATNNGPASAAVLIPLTDDLTNPTSLTTKKTKTSGVGLA